MFLRILLLVVGVSSDVPGKIKQYECGEHGRFEYCVDGVPGCVVGCHCHPGYYFDTESKICEPNTKLVQDYRRHFLSEPTRVQIPITPSYDIEIVPTLSTKTPLDNQVDQALAKDTDDIGDWLYNQFFKTIENQVLDANNNTDSSNADSNNQTRRTGSGPSQKKTKRRKVMPKKIKFSKISKKNDLRRKLLRITEDDSLFDSDSRSMSRSTEDSKSSSNSDSSDTSLETDDNDDDKKRKDKDKSHTNDKEHGHRKILVVKKKPKPPLPSFIFLPNLETPFFPPIGLPPPPLMPMYPMVPVPPMPLPPFPFTMVVTTESDDKTKGSKKTTHSPSHTTTEPNKKTHTPEHSTAHTTTTETTGHKVTEKTEQPVTAPSEKPSLRSRMLRRKKLLRQFREKHPGPFIPFDHRKSMKDIPPINPLMPSANDYMDMEDMMEEMTRPPPPRPPPVDFKYLSQLIHKMNPNISNGEVKKKVAAPQRRFQTQYYHHEPEVADEPLPLPPNEISSNTQLPEGEDSYYANLGQQIASLIRKIDNAGPQVNPKSPSPNEGIINGDNNYASRSYWERSVRSLFSHYPPNTNDINFLKNEENLLNLENKVKVAATTQRSWNLNDLENVIFLEDRIKPRIDNMKMKKIQDNHKENLATQTNLKKIEPQKSLKIPETENLNINLLPRHTDMQLGEKKESSSVSGRRNIQQSHITIKTSETKNKTVNPLEELINRQSIHYNLRGILLQNFKNIFQKSDNQKQQLKYVNHNGTNVNHKTIAKPVLEGTSLRKLIRMDQLQSLIQNKSLRPKVKLRAKPRPKEIGSNERLLSTVKVLTKPSADIQQLNPMLSSYKNTPLHPSHHNKYIFENDALAFQLSPAQTQQERAYYQVPHHHNYFD